MGALPVWFTSSTISGVTASFCPFPQQSVAQFVPCSGQIKADVQFTAQHAQTAEALHHALPQPAVAGGVDARVGGVGVGITSAWLHFLSAAAQSAQNFIIAALRCVFRYSAIFYRE